MKIFFVNDSSSNPNWGDRAAAIALKRMIVTSGGVLHHILTEDELREGWLNGAPTLFDEEHHEDRDARDWMALLLPPIFPKLANRIAGIIRKGESRSLVPATVHDFESYARAMAKDHARFGTLLSAITRSDIILVHGDGCMVGNGVLPRTELFLCYLAKVHFGKPVLLVNHTADLAHPDLNAMAQVVYPLLDDVTYRDKTSLQLCAERWPGRYAADSAFYFKPAEKDAWCELASRATFFDVWPDKAEFDPKLPYVCVGGSSIYSFYGPPKEIIGDFICLIRHIQSVYSGQIVLTASDLKDQIIFRPVAQALNLPLVALTTPVQQAVDIIGNAQAYIGGRWHPSIFALRGGAPVVPLVSKTFKIEALVKMAGLAVPTFDALDLCREKEGIGKTLNAVVAEGEKLRASLREWAHEQSTTIWEHLSFFRTWQQQKIREQ